jgi:hypothetical protein
MAVASSKFANEWHKLQLDAVKDIVNLSENGKKILKKFTRLTELSLAEIRGEQKSGQHPF